MHQSFRPDLPPRSRTSILKGVLLPTGVSQHSLTVLNLTFVSRLIDKKSERRYDDCLKYTLVGSKKALADAGLSRENNPEAFEKLDKNRVGVLVGSGMGGLQVFQDGVTNLVEKACPAPPCSTLTLTALSGPVHIEPQACTELFIGVARCADSSRCTAELQAHLAVLHPLCHHQHGLWSRGH